MDLFWMPVHFDEWHNATREMSDAEFRAFFNVCTRAWRSSDRQWPIGCVPDDDEKLARIIGGKRPRQAIAAVREIFQPSPDHAGFLTWPHLSDTLEKALAKGAKNKERAKGAARARWDSANDAPSNAPSIDGAPSEHAPRIQSNSDSQSNSQSEKENTSAAAAATGFYDRSALQKLLTAANAGILRGYGVQRRGITEDTTGSKAFLALLEQSGIDADFAATAIEAHAASRPGESAPASLTYFAQAVREKWAVECALRERRSPAPEVDRETSDRELAIRMAQSGIPQWQRKCEDEGIEWRNVLTTFAEKKRNFRLET